MHGQADPGGGLDGGEVDVAGQGGDQVGGHDAEEDRDDLDHALAPDIADDDHEHGHEGDAPVAHAAVDRGGGQVQADTDDDGAGDDGREVAHDLAHAEGLEGGGQDAVHESGAGHAKAGVGQKLRIAARGDGEVAAEEGEGGAQEGRDLLLGDQMEQQRAEAREQQRGRDAQPRQGRHQHGRAEHGEHVLQTEDQHLGRAERARVVHGVGVQVLVHSISLSL